MILKKPYAFLVKHFRIIHTLLLLCASYLFYRTWNIASFFDTYISNNLRVNAMNLKDISSTYVTIIMYFLSFIVILLCGTIIYLLKYKKKPVKFYIYILITYFLVLVSYFFAGSYLSGLEYNIPDLRLVNIIKDVYRVISLIQVPVLIITFFRAIGFDVSKFDFKKDLLDLGINEEDNEEYEFELKFDSDEVRSKAKKGFRYFKYFYLENKLLFYVIGVAIVVIVFTLILNSFLSREKIYSQDTNLDIGSFKAKIIDVYKTNLDVKGNKINSKYYYVIAKIRLENKSNNNSTFNRYMLRLSYGDSGNITSTTDLNSKFSEFGVNYFSQIIKAGETRDFVFIFEVPIEYYDSSLMLKYLMNIKYKDGKMDYNYKKVNIKPKELSTKTIKIDEKKLGEELVLKNSLLGDTKIVINDIKFSDTFIYDVVRCNSSGCTTRSNSLTATTNSPFDLTLMRINYNIEYDTLTLGKKYYNKNFFTTYGSIRFEVNGKEYNNRLELTDVTPYYTNNYSFLQVREMLLKADKIYLDFTIRDKVYTYVIKDTKKENG